MLLLTRSPNCRSSGKNGSLESLPQRIQQQAIVNQRSRSWSNKGVSKAASRGKKAKRMMAEGAYRKITTNLTSEMIQFTAEKELRNCCQLAPSQTQL